MPTDERINEAAKRSHHIKNDEDKQSKMTTKKLRGTLWPFMM